MCEIIIINKMLKKRTFDEALSTGASSQETKKINAPDVDAKISGYTSYEVCKSSSGEFLSTYLMNSDCGNNHNKYYILQLLKLKASSDSRCWLHTRYGRVGDPGVQGMALMANLAAGEKAYIKTFN
jgi:predicted DNA-binding WGR domain protein